MIEIMVMMILMMMMIIIVIIIAIMIMMIKIILIIAVVIINSPFRPGDFSTGFTTDINAIVIKELMVFKINAEVFVWPNK